MNIKKTLQILTCLACLLTSINVSGQNPGWTTCSATSGTLDGSTSNILISDTLAAATFVVSPSPTSTIPQTEFLIIKKNSLASDSLGGVIISTSTTGAVSPQDIGLMVGDTFSVVPFSYEILQIKLAVRGILFDDVNIFLSCCSALDIAAPFPGICDSLNAAGISDSSDINNVNDLLNFISAFTGGGSTSLRGLNSVLVGINDPDQIGTLEGLGCTNGVSLICYATDSLPQNQSHHIVTSISNTNNIEGNADLKIAVNPNPFTNLISTGIISEMGGQHNLRVFDATGKLVHQEVKVLSAGEQHIRMDLGNLSSGIYFLQVTNDKNIVTQKIIKR